ncbi:carcinine transporter-like [Leptopilina heterotoma]|uniref:carcinine transporter-like n=1 Tax=Leptopilina heterotoma TaxID=63436 RepID=UPI001CA7C847|nr:carcinine transporter-like [Leptopilina heterotoma]
MMIKDDDEDNNECLKIGKGKKNFETFDDVLPYIGDLGKYQWILITIFLPFGLAFMIVFFSQIFITAVPQKHWCKVNEFIDFNLTKEQRFKLVIPQGKYPFFDRCHYRKYNFPNISEKLEENYNFSKWETEEIIQCNQWEYDFNEIPYSSIGTELNWVCDQEYLVAAAQSIFYIGSICGNFLFGWISDRYGRKKGLLCCSATAFIASIGTANTHNFWSFALCRFFMGFAFDNIINIPLIIVLEYTATRKRSLIASLGVGFNLSIGVLILTWISYFSRNWRILAYINSVPLLVCFLLTFLMPESIRWYVSRGKFEEIKKRIRRISEVNGKNPEFRIID